MKKRSIILLLTLFFVSCNWIDLEPETSVTYTNFYKTESDAEALLVNGFIKMRTAFTMTNKHSLLGAKADYVKSSIDKDVRKLSPTQISHEKTTESWGVRGYSLVHAAHALIDEEYRFVKNGEISRERLDFYLRQAHFIRAIGYFTLARTWGDAPILPNHYWSEKLGRSLKEEVLDEAIKSAKIALELPKFNEIVDCNGTRVESKMWASQGAAAALLSDIHAWKGAILNSKNDTEMAIKYCTDILDGKYGSYPFAGSPARLCTEVLSVRRGPESIWEIDIFESDGALLPSTHVYPASPKFIGLPLKPTSVNIESLPMEIYAQTIMSLYDEGDMRRTEFFKDLDKPIAIVPEDKRPVYFYKFRNAIRKPDDVDRNGYINIDCNRVVYRTTGILLLRAECRNRIGDTPGAIADLNQVRGFSNAKAYPGGKMDDVDLTYSIFMEWEKEFIIERERYYDVVRNGYWKTEINPSFPELTEQDVKDGALYLPMTKFAIKQGNDLLVETPFWIGR